MKIPLADLTTSTRLCNEYRLAGVQQGSIALELTWLGQTLDDTSRMSSLGDPLYASSSISADPRNPSPSADVQSQRLRSRLSFSQGSLLSPSTPAPNPATIPTGDLSYKPSTPEPADARPFAQAARRSGPGAHSATKPSAGSAGLSLGPPTPDPGSAELRYGEEVGSSSTP